MHGECQSCRNADFEFTPYDFVNATDQRSMALRFTKHNDRQERVQPADLDQCPARFGVRLDNLLETILQSVQIIFRSNKKVTCPQSSDP